MSRVFNPAAQQLGTPWVYGLAAQQLKTPRVSGPAAEQLNMACSWTVLQLDMQWPLAGLAGWRSMARRPNCSS